MPRTGHDFVFDETVPVPHYERRMATFFLKARPQMDYFGTRHWRGRRVWLWTRGKAGGRASGSCGGGRARKGMGIGLHRTPVPYYYVWYVGFALHRPADAGIYFLFRRID